MLVIRFARTGKKKQAYYRIVVAEKQRAVTSKFIEILGNYDPHAKKLSLKQEKLEEYLKNGAQPSNSVAKLLAKEGVKLPNWVKITEKKKAPKKVEEQKEAPAAAKEEAPEASEAPAEDGELAESTEEAVAKEEVAVEESKEEAAESTEPAETPAESGEQDESTEEGEEKPEEAEIKEDNK